MAERWSDQSPIWYEAYEATAGNRDAMFDWLSARLSSAEQERDEARRSSTAWMVASSENRHALTAAEARAEAAERQIQLLLEANARANDRVRAALAGREETGGGETYRDALIRVHEYNCGCNQPGNLAVCVAPPTEAFSVLGETGGG